MVEEKNYKYRKYIRKMFSVLFFLLGFLFITPVINPIENSYLGGLVTIPRFPFESRLKLVLLSIVFFIMSLYFTDNSYVYIFFKSIKKRFVSHKENLKNFIDE